MLISIKNMVCPRCILTVKDILKRNHLDYQEVSLGEVHFRTNPTHGELKKLNLDLKTVGFELLDTEQKKKIEKVKILLTQQVQLGKIEEHFSIGRFFAERLVKDYPSISRLFSQVEGKTIEQFFIQLKIEKVKEWLVYNELTLSEIAWKLGYSGVAHLSAQFKKITGLSPSQFKGLLKKNRKNLDQI
ncbi:MAG: hypothetical protein NVS1B13_12560 [Flavisolibacter sp.]